MTKSQTSKKTSKKMCNSYIGTNKSCQFCKHKKGTHYHGLTTGTRKKCKNIANTSNHKKCKLCIKHPKDSHYHK